MSILHSEQTQTLINRLASSDTGYAAGSDSEMFLDFVRDYYHGIPYEDLSKRELFDLKGAASAHWQMARFRGKGETNIRIYSPEVERDGWRSDYMVLEIVATDRPFIVDSVSMVFSEMGLKVYSTIHPVMTVLRDEQREIQKAVSPTNADFLDGEFESFIHIEFDKPESSAEVAHIRSRLERTFDMIECAVTDWQPMRKRVHEAADNLKALEQQSDDSSMEDYSEFCEWLLLGNFTFLGYYELNFSNGQKVELDRSSVLGVLKNYDEIGEILPDPDFGTNEAEQVLSIIKANEQSPIHRPTYMDLINIPNYSDTGTLIGVRGILGLFGSTAYNGSASLIPLVRNKIKYVLQRSKFAETTHSIRELTNIIDNYPRDMLFQVSGDELFEDVAGILELLGRQRVKVLLRREQYNRFYSAIVYIPQELFNRNLRIKIEEILMESLRGNSSEFFATFSASILARITYSIYVDQASTPLRDLPTIQQLVEDASVTWNDSVQKATIQKYGQDLGRKFFKRYSDSFSASYQEYNSPWMAAADLIRFSELNQDNNLIVSFYRTLREVAEQKYHLKLYSYNKQISPSDALPYLENMGLRVLEERPYEIRLKTGESLWVHDFILVHSQGVEVDPDEQRGMFEEAFQRIWRNEAENDGFNILVLSANLSWRQVVLLRACSRYLRQIGTTFSETYIIQTLTSNVGFVRQLVDYFELSFDPELEASATQKQQLLDELNVTLDEVSSLDEDIILRSYLNVVTSMLRTNYYCIDDDGQNLPYLSFKIDAAKILKMPDPRPKYEIFVYSPRVEAVHLRGGSVARGGLRWSDRREDFRTEVLGLVKAQMVKNAVIVPVGSKGGFYVKQPPPDRNAFFQEGIACYKIFISGLLDLTDNIVGEKIVRPNRVKCYDDVDPYLVVAADKGTATFSDIANGLSEEYGFWLGDAFASGGSEGYDHKGMGITARGAWESVKRHFRELGVNTQTTDFTVLGIGDMSGDVFGNGMLLSRHIRLVAAFNHIEIFVDPNPDSATSFVERERLFNSPGLTWKDYNRDLISEGGGVFQRSAKAIEISAQMQKRFKITETKLTPNELLHAMLKAPVDLLWNGGIGTYVKATTESHADAANRSNDQVRVNGNQLGCKVVGEGGNLGMTQLGRVEYCLNGGRCYTDFIDNSAGVDCSDHEVNIKILLNHVVANGEMTTKQRNNLLRAMTDEVAELVLVDNYQQSQALSLLNVQSSNLLQEHIGFIRELELAGELNRKLEFLPDSEELLRRESLSIGLQLPELSVLLAYSKMTLYQELLESDVTDDPFLIEDLEDYFPVELAERFSDDIHQHRLKREIVATYLTNNLVNRGGPTFAYRMRQFTGASNVDIARAYCVTKAIFSMNKIWKDIEALDNQVPAQIQMKMLLYTEGLLQRATLWLLRHRATPLDVSKNVSNYESGMDTLMKVMSAVITDHHKRKLDQERKDFTKQNVPEALAQRVTELITLSTALDILDIVRSTDKDVTFVASVYYNVGARLDLLWIREKVSELPVENHWHSRAKSRLSDDIHSHQHKIASEVVRGATTGDPVAAVRDWMNGKSAGCKILANIISDMKTLPKIDFATLSVAISEVNSLGRPTD